MTGTYTVDVDRSMVHTIGGIGAVACCLLRKELPATTRCDQKKQYSGACILASVVGSKCRHGVPWSIALYSCPTVEYLQQYIWRRIPGLSLSFEFHLSTYVRTYVHSCCNMEQRHRILCFISSQKLPVSVLRKLYVEP